MGTRPLKVVRVSGVVAVRVVLLLLWWLLLLLVGQTGTGGGALKVAVDGSGSIPQFAT